MILLVRRSMTALFFLLFLTSCMQTSEQKKSRENTLRINFFAEPPSLDPRRVSYSISSNILPMLYDGLTRFDPSGILQPAVAKKYKVSEDGKTYTFFLRKTTWSNGDKVTAYDFEYAWKWMLNPENPAPMASHLYCIRGAQKANEGVIAVDSVGVYAKDCKTLVVELENPLPCFPELVSTCNFFPIHSGKASDLKHSECIGNGPFKLTEWKPGQKISLTKNPKHWDANSVSLEGIEISFLDHMNSELELFQRGELDWAGAPIALGIQPCALPVLREQKMLNTQIFLSTYFYTFNTTRKPFQSPKVRIALSAAIPREKICQYITQGDEEPAHGFVPPSISSVRTPENSQSDAELLALFEEGLAEQGISKGKLKTITISYNNSELHHAIAQAVQHRWKKLFGVNVALRKQDWKSHLSEISVGNFDVARLTWKGMTSDPLHFLDIFVDPKHPMQRSSWVSSPFRNAIHTAAGSPDPAERARLLGQAEKILNRDMPVAPLFFGTMSYVKNPYLQNVYLTQLGYVDFKWARFTP